MAGIPFKVCVPSSNVQVGVVARSYEHFRDLLQTKLGLAKDSQVYLEDGTLICDEEYFDLLEPQTKLTIIEPEKKLKGSREYIQMRNCSPLLLLCMFNNSMVIDDTILCSKIIPKPSMFLLSCMQLVVSLCKYE